MLMCLNSNVLANDVRAHLNLSRIIDVAKQDTASFQSLQSETTLGLLITIQYE
jgi:hypothetical protein